MKVRTPTEFSTADSNLGPTLDSLSGADNYLEYLLDLISPFLGRDVLEVGAGLGDLTDRMSAGRSVLATDYSEYFLAELEARFSSSPSVETEQLDATSDADVSRLGSGRFDSALLVNVLEHLPNDHEVLTRLSRTLRPGGRMIVFVPAFEMLYGKFDEMVGHHRRYRSSSMTAAFLRAGLEPLEVRYVNLPGWFAWMLTVRMLSMVPTSECMVQLYDRTVVPLLRRFEAGHPPPFGQSVLGVATRPASGIE